MTKFGYTELQEILRISTESWETALRLYGYDISQCREVSHPLLHPYRRRCTLQPLQYDGAETYGQVHKQQSLNKILDTHSDLAVCYAMKEELCALFQITDENEARHRWSNGLTLL